MREWSCITCTNYGSETAWSGSGGGISAFEAEPSYQMGVQHSGFRSIPDVALDAAPSTGVPVYDSYDGYTVDKGRRNQPILAGLGGLYGY